MDESKKRKAETHTDDANGRKPKKSKKQWRTPKKGQQQSTAPTILPGDSGIWATCAMHKEAKTTGELRDLFEDYAAKLYGESISDTNDAANDGDDDDDDADNVDIEMEISKELQGMKSASTKKKALFRAVRVDVQCLLFFKTRVPIEPVSFVHSICEDANNGQGAMRSRFAKRLTPMVRMGKASPVGLDEVARTVLGPVFHAEGAKGKKFAIRPTIRNNNTMKRDDMIRQIATIVGPGHMVDLKGYDVLILVDVYRVGLPWANGRSMLTTYPSEHAGDECGWERLREAQAIQLG